MVAPLVGVWIEKVVNLALCRGVRVAPLVGAWIEKMRFSTVSMDKNVAPLVGVWIENCIVMLSPSKTSCRTPRGCVD